MQMVVIMGYIERVVFWNWTAQRLMVCKAARAHPDVNRA